MSNEAVATLEEWKAQALKWMRIADAEATKCYEETRLTFLRQKHENARLKRLLQKHGIYY